MPDYIGFIFAESRRRVDIKTAAGLKSILNPKIKAAGVFVNEEPGKAASLCSAGIIDIIQLHGDEDDAYIKTLKTMVKNPVIKAVPMGSGNLRGTAEANYILLDSFDKQKRGGSGAVFDWSSIKDVTERVKKPFFLAGGLNESNLSAAAQTKPFAFDVSSGAETDGFKDKEKMVKIVRIARGL